MQVLQAVGFVATTCAGDGGHLEDIFIFPLEADLSSLETARLKLREFQASQSLAKPFMPAPRGKVVAAVIARLIQQLESIDDPLVCARSFNCRCTSALPFIRYVC